MKKAIFVLSGFICLALGTIGTALPVLPTVPFYLAAAFFFARSSDRLHDWFLGTALYRNHLESFAAKRGMRVKTKLGILLSVTAIMGVGMFFMARAGVWIPCLILAAVWAGHLVYFCFGVPTLKEEEC